MRTILVFLLIVLLTVSALQAQGAKMGFVSDQDILRQMPAKVEVQRILDQETAIWEQRFQGRQQEMQTFLDSVTALDTRLESMRDTTAAGGGKALATDSTAADTLAFLEAEHERLEKVLEGKKKDLLAYYHQIYGKDGVLNRRNAELTQSILEKLHATISDISKTMQLSVMLDASALLYIDQEYNYTEQVMEALNIETQRTR
jgi:Skp family chaperone for outer membrane proteins